MPRVNHRETLFDHDTSCLLPCPFCGPIDHIRTNESCYMTKDFSNGHNWHYFVECMNCGCEAKFFAETIEQAVIDWNTRPALSDTEEFMLGYIAAKRDLIKYIERDLSNGQTD